MARIQLENVKKKFGKVTALDGVTIDVKDNEFFVLFGPAGAGKTTMLNCIAGITLPDKVRRGDHEPGGPRPPERGHDL